MENIILNTDSYKHSHFLQYPPNTRTVYSYIESRGGEYDKTVFFGLQMFIKKYLTKPVTMYDVNEARDVVTAHGEPFNYEGWKYIVDKHRGFLPLSISAVPEGTVLPTKNALVVVHNTDPKVPWLTSFIETALLRAIWYPTTVATISYNIKKVIAIYLEATGDPSLIDFKLHDFGARGVSSKESAGIGGLAHLVNFKGTDTMEALMYARRYYGEPMAGFSIPAAEHSTITSWGKDNEAEAYTNMVKQFAGPGKIYAVVSDSYDLFNAVDNIWGDNLKDLVETSGGTVVIRPDSGDPVYIVTEVMQRLYKKFGGTVNAKGYKVLNPAVRVIQGDGINESSIHRILKSMSDNGFSADNIAFGMGGALLQHMNRDTLKFAMKASAVVIGAEGSIPEVRDVYKDPATDPGKASKRGILRTIKEGDNYRTVNLITEYAKIDTDIMQEVYKDGYQYNDQSLGTIRARAV